MIKSYFSIIEMLTEQELKSQLTIFKNGLYKHATPDFDIVNLEENLGENVDLTDFLLERLSDYIFSIKYSTVRFIQDYGFDKAVKLCEENFGRFDIETIDIMDDETHMYNTLFYYVFRIECDPIDTNQFIQWVKKNKYCNDFEKMNNLMKTTFIM